MRLRSGYEAKKARVEMLPLIDVVFLLLVFFIYAMVSMVVHRGLEIDLPAAATAALDQQQHVTITLDADNLIYLNGEATAADELPRKVLALMDGTDTPVFIDGDRNADLGPAIQLLDDLKSIGIQNISFSCNQPAP